MSFEDWLNQFDFDAMVKITMDNTQKRHTEESIRETLLEILREKFDAKHKLKSDVFLTTDPEFTKAYFESIKPEPSDSV